MFDTSSPTPSPMPALARLDLLIEVTGDSPAIDLEVLELATQADFIALGRPTVEEGTAQLLHCEVPIGDETVRMLPVFTRMDYVQRAIEVNPSWADLDILVINGWEVLRNLGEDEWLGINPWTKREFKLPPS